MASGTGAWKESSSEEGDSPPSSLDSTPTPTDDSEPHAEDPMLDSAYLEMEEPFWKHGQEDIIFAGFAVRLPESDSYDEFAAHLLAGEDMLTENDRRYTVGIYDLPKRHGKLKIINRFDSTFFGCPPVQANKMDPQIRLLLETCFEAIMDAGYNPQEFRGSRTGVFVGTSASETSSFLTSDPEEVHGYALTGTTRSMFANRLSYALDLRGPSFAVDTACSSSLLAFQLAVDAIRQGECDSALVCGSHLTLTAVTSLQFLRLGMLSPTASCKSFDEAADGYARAEGIGSIFLQRASASRRCYATVVHAKSATDGYKEQGITFPSGARQAQLLDEVYREAGVHPATVAFVEAHGTGTKVGDPQEANAITDVFCRDREGPLLIGSVKSNMGHAEPASGIASVAKVVTAMESGLIPPNLHFNNPNSYIPGLTDGRLKVVTESTPWKGGYVGINSFGFGGSNTHVCLKSNEIEANSIQVGRAAYPKLICVAGRTAEGVASFLDAAELHKDNPHFHALLANVAGVAPNLFPFRGYTLLHRNASEEPLREVLKVGSQNEKRPVWYIFSGMGSQWVGMAKDMMQIDTFKESIIKCSDTLRPLGVDPYAILMAASDDAYKSTQTAMVCITAVQLALCDLLSLSGLTPDGIIGHSTGEIAAGYADGCLSREEAILLAFHRGQSVITTKFPPGAMAAVGLSWEEAKRRCPEGVMAACHNGADSVTVSGRLDAVEKMVAELEAEGVFVKLVQSQGIAFHSSDMERVKEKMTAAFQSILPTPRKRTGRWVSSSIPEADWGSELGLHVSAEYHVNNALNPVLFHEALQKIPEAAITVELAPHCLMQSVLRRSLAKGVTNVGLMKAKHADNVEHCLAALGKLHSAGAKLDVTALYPSVPFPVPRGTPSISSVMKWDHAQEFWCVDGTQLSIGNGGLISSATFRADPLAQDSKDLYLLDHVIDGRALYPFTGFIVMAWRALCKLRGIDFQKTPVIFEDVSVHRPTLMTKPVKFDCCMVPATGKWEVMEDGQLTASGTIRIVEEEKPFFYSELEAAELPQNPEHIELTTQEIYKEFLLRGYEYGPQFRGIYKTCNSGDRGTLFWTGNWVTFLDAFLQTALLSERGETLRLPTRLRYMRIDPIRHLEKVVELDDLQVVHLRNDIATRGCIAGGVEVCDLASQSVQRRLHASGRVILEKVFFINHIDSDALARWPAVRKQMGDYESLCKDQLKKLLGAWGPKVLKTFANSPQLLEAAANLAKEQQETVSEKLAAKLTKSKADSSSLYRLLCKLNAEPVTPEIARTVGEEIRAGMAALEADGLWKGAWAQETCKPLFDIVFENTAGHNFTAVAVDNRSLSTLRWLRSLQMTHPLIEAAFSTISPESRFTEEELGVGGMGYIKLNVEKGESLPESIKPFDVAVLDRVLSQKVDPERFLQNLKRIIRDDGFLLVVEPTRKLDVQVAVESLLGSELFAGSGDGGRVGGLYLSEEEWRLRFVDAGFHVLGLQSDSALASTIFLVRALPSIPRTPHIVECDDVAEFSWLEPLKTLWEEKLTAGEEETIWITNTQTMDNGMLGLSLCLREESQKYNRFRSLVDVSHDAATARLDLQSPVVQQKIFEDLHANVYRDGAWGSYRHLVVEEDGLLEFCEAEHAFVNTVVRGDLSSLNWVQSPLAYWAVNPRRKPNQELLSVYYAALNFRDIMLATGRLPPDAIPGDFADRDCLLGMEFSGRMSDGSRRMGILPAQALATTVVCDPDFSWEVPAAWTMREAATVPVAYTTAYYALIVRGRLRKGESVLIHSGSGGVGQAAIAIALGMGCNVFTSVGSPEKRAFLHKRFPDLKDDQICHSRSTSFEWAIRSRTKGRGVNLVLNSLSEDKLQASLRCLADHGRFLEIGKFDLANNSSLGMALFLKNVTFHGILLDSLMEEGASNHDWITVAALLQAGIKDGTVRPLPSHVFGTYQAEEAFRFMAQGKHMGKVLMEVRAEDEGLIRAPPAIKVRAVRRSHCHPEHVYLITGGLGGFGLELAQWLIHRGATKLVLTSRSGVKTGYQARCLYYWRRTGIRVEVSTFNVATQDGANKLLAQCLEMGPLGGLFHLAMVLRDCLFENQHVGNFKDAAEAKYHGTRNLDAATRRLCGPELRWFIAFSSITSGRGNAGQTNYGWANATMERIVEKRRYDGLSGMAVQWGAIGDVGVILENMGDNSTVVGGTLPQRMPSCLQALDTFLCWDEGLVSSFIRADTNETRAGSSGDMVQAIAHILGVSDISQLDPNTTLGDLGLDSLMGVEIKQALERDYNLVMSMKEIRALTLNKLKELSDGAGSSTTGEDGEVKKASSDVSALASMASNMEDLEAQMSSIFKLRIDVKDMYESARVVRLNAVGPESGRRPVFFCPSIEGIGKPLLGLGARMEAPAFCFQYVPGTPSTDIPSVANYYMEAMKQIQPEGPYNIVGYSYGACVGFDIACQLQRLSPNDAGIVSTLMLLDGSHKYMQTYREVYRKSLGVLSPDVENDPIFQVEILVSIAIRYASIDYRAFRRELMKEAGWEEKKAKATELISANGLFKDTTAVLRSCQIVFDEFAMADIYHPNYAFKGDITLVRAEKGAARDEDVGRDYGVSEVATEDVHVHIVPGDHDSFVSGESSNVTASIINDCLSSNAAPSIASSELDLRSAVLDS